MYTDKQQTKTKILKLVSKLIPALVLSLSVTMLFNATTSAASVTQNFNANYSEFDSSVYPSLTSLNTVITNPSSTPGYLLDIETVPGHPAFLGWNSIASPCSSNPSFSVTHNITITPDTNLDSSNSDGVVLSIADKSTGATISQTLIDINGPSDNDFSAKTASVSASGLTGSNIVAALYVEGTTRPSELMLVQIANYSITYDDATCPVVNSTPTANPDSVSTSVNTPLTINPLANDTDPESDALSIYKINDDIFTVGTPINLPDGSGTVTVNSNGTITFEPAPGFVGPTSFTYNISDGVNTSYTTVSLTVTPTTTSTSYCLAPGSTTQALSPAGDCDSDGITNQEEGYDPDGDGNPTTGTSSIDTDKDGTPDYIDTDSDNDKLTDKQEGTKDTNNNKIPDFRDPTKTLANTGTSLNLILSLSALAIIAGFGLKKVRG